MKVKVTIPTSLDEIKLRDFQKFTSVVNDNPEAEELIAVKMLQYFCGLKVKDIRMLKHTDVEEMVMDIYKCFDQKPEHKMRFKHNGIEYGFIPNLDEMTMGEYIDINTYIDDVKQAHKALAVLYRPIVQTKGDQYLIEKYKGTGRYSDAMESVPCSVYLGVKVFFYRLGIALINHTLVYSNLPQEEVWKLKTFLTASGDGTTAFTHSLRATLLNLMPSPN